MFAFVHAPTRTAIAVEAPPVRTTPLTLNEELEALGLHPIPLGRVRKYQADTVRAWEAQSSLLLTYHGQWERVEAPDMHALNPPHDVVEDMGKAATIPGAEVYAERFKGDPFVFVERLTEAHGVEAACFTFWDAPGFKR